MSRYIDAEKLKDLYQPIDGKDYKVSMDIVRLNIDDIPTADVQEIKHGKWINRRFIIDVVSAVYHTCSNCNEELIGTDSDNYCSKCGAIMDGE